MRRVLTVAAFLAATLVVSPSFAQTVAQEPACGYETAPKPCVAIHGGVVTLILRDSRHEYASGGIDLHVPYKGLGLFINADAFAVQDGAAADFGRETGFRAIKYDMGLGKSIGALTVNAHFGITYSIEGRIGAPLDPREFDAQVELALDLRTEGNASLLVGHSGESGGWAAIADVNLPVTGGKSLIAHYEFPFRRDPMGKLPWTLIAGGQVRLKAFRLHF